MSTSIVNILIKLTAVLLAVLLWFYVVSQKHYEYSITLPVTKVDLPVGLGPVAGIPDSLRVKVLAEGQKLLGSEWKKAGLRLKASRMRRGLNQLELNLETVALVHSGDLNLMELSGPTAITVHLDRIDTVYKPAASRLTVRPAKGFAVVSAGGRIAPSRLPVIGPVLLLERLDSLHTRADAVDEARGTVRLTLPLESPASLSLVPGKDSVAVTVEVDTLRVRYFENFPVEVVSHTPRRRVNVDPAQIALEVEGPKSVIDSLTEKSLRVWVTPPIMADESYSVPEVALPVDVRLKRIIPDSLHIQVAP